MTNQEFIEFLVPQAQKGYVDYGVFPSVTIAQAIWESGWGGSYLSKTDYNLFGIKYPGNHDSSITVTQGTWATDDGGYYAHYDSWGDSCLDHGFFLANNSRYASAGAFTATNPFDQIQAIANAGYASDTNYASSISSVINSNNLTQYDTGTYTPIPPNPPAPDQGNSKYGEVYNKITTTSYNINQLTTDQKTFLQSLYFNGTVKITYTFDRRKYNGVNFTGKRLTIDDKSYIIVDVENNGFIKLTNDINNKCYKFVNPKLLKEG
jgi:uncharacterized FlgJ-related protein